MTKNGANKKGTGLLMVWCEVPVDIEDEFNRWYNEEHIEERLSIPGILSAARYEAVVSGPKHLAVYELESSAIMESDEYLRGALQPHRVVEANVAGVHRHHLHTQRVRDDTSRRADRRDSEAAPWLPRSR